MGSSVAEAASRRAGSSSPAGRQPAARSQGRHTGQQQQPYRLISVLYGKQILGTARQKNRHTKESTRPSSTTAGHSAPDQRIHPPTAHLRAAVVAGQLIEGRLVAVDLQYNQSCAAVQSITCREGRRGQRRQSWQLANEVALHRTGQGG